MGEMRGRPWRFDYPSPTALLAIKSGMIKPNDA
jgi:hypothetical protein